MTGSPGDGRPRSAVRLLHTSDVHIAGEDDSLQALRAVIDTAARCDVDLVLIAGDLFDNSRVPAAVADQVTTELERLARPVVVIPGNHDCMDEGSIYHRVDLTRAGPHVHFVGDAAGRLLMFDDLGVAVWARGIENHDPSHHPLDGFSPAPPDYWSVAVTHGHYVGRDEGSIRSSQINQDEIARLDCDYLALGHWHRFVDVSEGKAAAFYSGSPSESWLEERTVNLVTLHPDSGVHVERREIGLRPGL